MLIELHHDCQHFVEPSITGMAENVVAISVVQQQCLRGNGNSLIKQRRDVLSNPGKLEKLALTTDHKNFQLIRGAACVT